jgi:hypothetical protein
LTESGRFTVLDREFDAQRTAELNRISDGKSNKNDLAKIGQELSADLVWMGTVNDFAYNKTVRKLQTSDRELVSFSGGWSVSQRMINLTTSGLMLSSTIQEKLPSVSPTTLGASFDEVSIKNSMQTEFVKKTTDAIILKMFPISIVKIDGTSVKLSQGGNSVKENARYKIYLMGEEIFDPQTKESLGNDEKYCCEVVITRVQPKFSEGTLENVKISLDGMKPGVLQVREAITSAAGAPVVSPTPAAATAVALVAAIAPALPVPTTAPAGAAQVHKTSKAVAPSPKAKQGGGDKADW